MKYLSTLRLRWSLLVVTALTGGTLLLTGCSTHSAHMGDNDHDGDANCFLLCDFDSDD